MPAKPRKIPMRMCVGCREMKEKKELLRLPAKDCSRSSRASESQATTALLLGLKKMKLKTGNWLSW